MKKSSSSLYISFFILVVWIGLFLYSHSVVPAYTLFLTSASYFLCLFPTVAYFYSEQNIPYLPFFGIFFFVYFGLSVFLNFKAMAAYIEYISVLNDCLLITMLGFLSMLVAFYSPVIPTLERIGLFRPLKISVDLSKAYKIGIVLGILGNVFYYFTVSGVKSAFFGGTVYFLADLSKLSFVLLYMLQLRGKLNLKGKIFLWGGVFIPRIMLGLVSGGTASIIIDCVLLFFVDMYCNRKIPWLKISVAAVLFFFVFSARDSYREITWKGYDEEYNTALKKAGLYLRLIGDEITNAPNKYVKNYDRISSRSDYLVTFIIVKTLTPNYVPYWGGETYKTLYTSFVPRFLMPDKPIKNVGQSFGHRYGLLYAGDETTSYNLPFIIEMFINFGFWGVIIGMFILGLIFRLFYLLINSVEGGDGVVLIGAVIFSSLLGIETDFSLIFGHTLQYVIVFYIVLKMMKNHEDRVIIKK